MATFPVCQKPLRFGNHFLDILEATDAIVWSDHAWRITDLGRTLLAEVREAEAAANSATATSTSKEA